MPLYKRSKDEAEFREKFVKLLLNRLGYYGVSEQHGTQEFGKDFVFSELHRLFDSLSRFFKNIKNIAATLCQKVDVALEKMKRSTEAEWDITMNRASLAIQIRTVLAGISPASVFLLLATRACAKETGHD
jgi:hypothetical protein